MFKAKIKRKVKELININTEKGSVTLFVLIAMIFFLVILGYQYINVKNKEIIQEKELIKIQESYEKDKDEIQRIYEEKTGTIVVSLHPNGRNLLYANRREGFNKNSDNCN